MGKHGGGDRVNIGDVSGEDYEESLEIN